MRPFVSLLTIATMATGAANASEFSTACTRGDDQRRIEVIAPGAVGAACDVQYFRGSSRSPSTPFHADNSQNFCMQKANELVNTLATAGYNCVATDIGGAAPAETAALPETPAPALATPEPTLVAPATATETADATAVSADILAEAPAAEGAAPAAPEPAELEDKMNAILALPDQDAAVRGPADLTDQAVDAVGVGQNAPIVGRIVGATPDAAPARAVEGAVAPVTQASLSDPVDAEAPPAPQTNQPAALISGPEREAAPVPAPEPAVVERVADSSPLRSPEDVVRATLNAQAAAWNEGNLDAFMETYWKDDNLKFVSGGDITKGWSATMKRYRERYADANGLGQLGLSQMDVEFVTDDVAVVTGRFNHSKDATTSSGAFSLVMRRDRGAWRIVHDHSVADARTAE